MWAVMFEIEKGERVYDTGKDCFTVDDKPLVFAKKSDAIEQAKKWNTGIVVAWLREFDDDERQASIERGKVNNVYS